MEQALYLECASGISGDMTVAALLDLGADEAVLKKVLSSVPAGGFRTEIGRVSKSGIDCCDFSVILDEAHENHDHDMNWLHGHEHASEHEGETHDHTHGHDHGHGHGHRHLSEIREILAHTDMKEEARALALRIFEILAEAEGKAHHLPPEEVAFHEVGAVDSIVDIISIAVCFNDLKEENNITDVIVRSVTEGSGTIRCQHGVLPVPVPAVVNIAERHGLPLRCVDVRGELVTPTGAAFLAAVRTADRLPEHMRILRTGLGAGKREYEMPGFLRVMLVESVSVAETGNF